MKRQYRGKVLKYCMILTIVMAVCAIWVMSGNVQAAHADGTIQGFYDAPDGTAGWACDPTNPDQTLHIEVYVGVRGQGGTLLGSADANQPRETAVGDRCGHNIYHGYSGITLSCVAGGGLAYFTVYAVNPSTGEAQQLYYSSDSTNHLTVLPACPLLSPGVPNVQPVPRYRQGVDLNA